MKLFRQAPQEEHSDRKPTWELFKIWGGSNRQYRLLAHIVTWAAIVLCVWIIWG